MGDSSTTHVALRREAFRTALALFVPLALAFGVELVDLVLPGTPLDRYGILPRSLPGLVGVPLAPFLHKGFPHLVGNAAPFCVFGFLVAGRSLREFAAVCAAATFGGGGLVWLFGRTAIHLGASGVVFGLFGYLVALGYYERRPFSIVVAVLVLLGYGGLVLGVLPLVPGISWESHLFGLLAGIAVARTRRGRIRS